MRDFWLKFAGILLASLLAALGARVTIPSLTPPEVPAADPREAICRLVMTNGFCSATIVNPQRPDGSYAVVSAAHCISRSGEAVRLVLRNGSEVKATVVRFDRKSDVAILRTVPVVVKLPYLRIAESSPAVGTKIFHSGFGVDTPGNVEEGSLVAGPNANGQVVYRLSVSPGDSGGGIVANGRNELLSPVCCTDALSRLGNVWGGSPEEIRRLLATETSEEQKVPIAMPSPPPLPPMVE